MNSPSQYRFDTSNNITILLSIFFLLGKEGIVDLGAKVRIGILSFTLKLNVLGNADRISCLVSITLGLLKLLERRPQFLIRYDKSSPLVSPSVIPFPMKRNLFTDPYSISKSSVRKLSRISVVDYLHYQTEGLLIS